jgi:hypothetical protein
MSTASADKSSCILETMTPAVENVRAVGTDEAGTGKKIWQSWI